MTEKEFSEIKIDEDVKGVAMTFSSIYNYRMICIIGLYLDHLKKKHSENGSEGRIPFFATNEDCLYKVGNGSVRKMPDIGSLIRTVTASFGIHPIVVGKPYHYGFDVIKSEWF